MTETTRRGFFRRLGGALVAAVVGPKVIALEERLDPTLKLPPPRPVKVPPLPSIAPSCSPSYSYSASVSMSPSASPSASYSWSPSPSASAWYGDNGEVE